MKSPATPLILLAGLVVVLASLGCGGSPAPPPAGVSSASPETSGDPLVLGFLVKRPEEPWFQDEWKYAQEFADKAGIRLVKIGAVDGEKVLTSIDNLAAQGARGFVICTPDVKLGPAIMAKAAGYGMKVFTVDDRLVGSDGQFMDVPYMGISARAIGETVGAAAWAEMQRRGWPVAETGVCVITFDELDTVKQRTDGAVDVLVQAGFPAAQIYRMPEKTTDTPGAFDAAHVLLTQHPEVKRWIAVSINDEGVLGAVRAMENRGFNADTIIGVGIGGSSALPEFQKPQPSGFCATCLINARRHGYEALELLYKWVKDGQEPPKVTLTAGEIITRENYREKMQSLGL
ncbi:arabinose ABC transporter substrate-binding protein [bacterium]|nr:arabinose ABC transporter substrate-binding protein [bacterium]